MAGLMFNPAPGWPVPPEGWVPPPGWRPEPSWPPAPPGWSFWVPAPDSTGPLSHAAPPPRTNQSRRSSNADSPNAQTAPSPARSASRVTHSEREKLSSGRSAGNGTTASPPRKATDRAVDSGVTSAPLSNAAELEARVQSLRAELIELTDAVLLQQVGIYQYHHPAENSEQYREELKVLQDAIKESVRAGRAITASDLFAYNNSLAQGRRMTRDFAKLMLRAYNAEADNCVRSVRAASVQSSKERLGRAASSIAKLGAMMDMKVTPEYHDLRLREIEITGDYMMMRQEERERAREERERLREERRAELELQAERERLDKEREHYLNSLSALESQGRAGEADALRARLAEIDDAIAQNDYRIANIRAGYVYVISNIGAFGEGVVKIGLTRRLEPLDRIRELGGASVPFPFDVHAIYFSKDAVELENQLHKAFADRRVNHVNPRREFFFVSPEEVRDVLTEKVGNLLDFQEAPEAEQYHQSMHYWPTLRADSQ